MSQMPSSRAAGTPSEVSLSEDALLAERCAFLQLTEDDRARVRELKPLFAAVNDSFVELFYEHLMQFPATAFFLRDARLVERLKAAQRQFFDSFFEANMDAARVAERRRIGDRHAAAGIEPAWFLGAFNQYIQLAFQRIKELPNAEQSLQFDALASLMKHIMLDIGLTLDAYYARSTMDLQQALTLYSQSNTELREFARLASHDLKTPLATIAGYCEEFLDEFGAHVPDEGRQLIAAALKRTSHMKGLIDELLSISEAAAQPGQRQLVNLQTLVDEVLERVRLDFGTQSIHFEIQDPMPNLNTHPARLREVLYHLISNAVKFMNKQPGLIWVTAHAEQKQVQLAVGDNGPGISDEDQQRIFAPFRRLKQHEHLAGHGLGLYMVRQIIEEQGGRIWCTSRLNEGCVFHIILPQ